LVEGRKPEKRRLPFPAGGVFPEQKAFDSV
jgi:hypothetical protein